VPTATTRPAGGGLSHSFATIPQCSDKPFGGDRHASTLALTESVTRLSDRSDPVPDDVWDEAAKQYDEQGLAALVLSIATTNFFNRLNATTKQPAGAWG
jgi:alkylhydroperoxidase family enzyme